MTTSSNNLFKWILPGLLALLVAPFTPYLDLAFAGHFYQDTHFSRSPFYTFIYHYATCPAFFVSFLSLVGLITSFYKSSLKKHRLSFFFLTLTMLLGPGLLINLLFKGFLVRPRPVHVLQFGGTELFKPFYHFACAYPNSFKSFPSGHATMGFYFLNLIILGRRLKNSLLINYGLIATCTLGLALSLARIAQGGHFFSDTFMSLCFIWYVGLLSDWFVFDFLAKKNELRYIKD